MNNGKERLIKALSVVNEYISDKNLLYIVAEYFVYLEILNELTDTKLQTKFKEVCKDIMELNNEE